MDFQAITSSTSIARLGACCIAAAGPKSGARARTAIDNTRRVRRACMSGLHGAGLHANRSIRLAAYTPAATWPGSSERGRRQITFVRSLVVAVLCTSPAPGAAQAAAQLPAPPEPRLLRVLID